ncbi:DNA polymerase delta small subunit Cdc1 [Cryomyces antarcticus]|nr:DNA polymerase delta small subunit Cdc1 [Cryomyces antarcticus]
MAAHANELLTSPSATPFDTPTRTPSSYNPLPTFTLAKGDQKHYQQQYADMYFARLAQLKSAVEQIAADAWEGFEIAGDSVSRVERVLDVRQGQLCWVVGTIYMEMPLKPNILDDISKDHWISAPPPRQKFLSPNNLDQIMLEDESGRLHLTGSFISSCMLVTGCIVAVMGTENSDGDFEVLDVKLPDLPRQPERWERDEGAAALGGKKVMQERAKTGKIAIVSGLGISAEAGGMLSLEMLMEYLLGETGSGAEQADAASISRLIIAGNSLAAASPIPTREEMAGKHAAHKKYGYDSSAYNAAPIEHLDTFLATLLPSLPVTILPGASDPSGVALPQQPIHAAMFPHSRAYAAAPDSAAPGWFDSATNPWEGDVDGWRVLGTGGQPVDDVFKYVEGEDRLEMMEAMLRWRLSAPTAPDTLWCYPFQDGDPFVVADCPHVFLVGNQPAFATAVIDGPLGQRVRLIAVPKFSDAGEVVLLDVETLRVEIVRFEVFGGGKGTGEGV